MSIFSTAFSTKSSIFIGSIQANFSKFLISRSQAESEKHSFLTDGAVWSIAAEFVMPDAYVISIKCSGNADIAQSAEILMTPHSTNPQSLPECIMVNRKAHKQKILVISCTDQV